MAATATRLATALLIAACALGAMPAGAKPLSKTLARTGLVPQDFTLMTEAADSLFVPAPAPGNRREWRNDNSGSRGNVQIIAVENGCAVLRHQFRPADAIRTGQLTTRRCRNAEGAWVAE